MTANLDICVINVVLYFNSNIPIIIDKSQEGLFISSIVGLNCIRKKTGNKDYKKS